MICTYCTPSICTSQPYGFDALMSGRPLECTVRMYRTDLCEFMVLHSHVYRKWSYAQYRVPWGVPVPVPVDFTFYVDVKV